MKIEDPAERRSILFRSDKLAVASEVGLRNKSAVADRLSYTLGDATFELKRDPTRSEHHLTSNAPGFRFVRAQCRPWTLPAPTKSYAFPDQARTYFQNSQFLSDFENAYVQMMDRILHLGPLRAPPRRQYTWAGSSPLDVGRSGENTVAAILAATNRNVKINFRYRSPLKPFQEMIAWWLKRMDIIQDFDVGEIADGSGLYRVNVKKDVKSPSTLIKDVGFGVSQILPALVLLNYAPEGSTIILEQPEIHLHPAVQSAFADVMITVAMSRNIQIILESHSEHILQRLLRRIAESEKSPYPRITNSDISLYFAQNRNGLSELTELKVNLFGSVENWPDDFFGDQFGEVAAREMAALKRRMKQA